MSWAAFAGSGLPRSSTSGRLADESQSSGTETGRADGLIRFNQGQQFALGTGVRCMEFVVIWLICAAIGAAITSSKNRGAMTGFFLGLILGIIGVIIAIFLPKQAPLPPLGMRAIRCPRCNADQNIPVSATSCECWQCKLILIPTSIIS